MQKLEYLDEAISFSTKKSIGSMKANFEGFDKPFTYTSQNSTDEICPDISFENKKGGKSYTEIAIKEDDVRGLVTRWKLLGTMASMKKGKLFLLAPRGHKLFTERIVTKHNINANVVSI